jgi:hypothetical protein
MGHKDLFKSSFIGDIYLVKFWSPTTYKLNTTEADLGGIIETVDYDNLVTVF